MKSEIEILREKLLKTETERDYWKNKFDSKVSMEFPATDWPKSRSEPLPYPEYDHNDKEGSFISMQQYLIDDICTELKTGYHMPETETTRIRHLLQYTLSGGKMNRGMMVVESAIILHTNKHPDIPITNNMLSRYCALGWCIEWLQAWLLILDDIMDGSETRRGNPCWYRCEGVGLIAVNDALLVEMMTYRILKRNFGKESYYPQLLDLFLESTYQTECGQLLDTMCANFELKDLTPQRWELISKYKTSYYSFYLVVSCAMVITGINDKSSYDSARELLIKLGVYFQAQDDFLDCYADPTVQGKIGTDIQDKKCSWLFVQSYPNSSESDKAIFDKYYGKVKIGSTGESIIKDTYTKLKMPALYEKFEKDSFDSIMKYKGATREVPWSIFESFLKKIYKRVK